MEARFVYITCGSQEEAERIAAALIQERLAACANLIPGMISLYHWEGEVKQDQEFILIAKTTAERVGALTQRVKALHSYEVPCVVALPIEGGNADFIRWLHTETHSSLH